jgi:hypothetical protein
MDHREVDRIVAEAAGVVGQRYVFSDVGPRIGAVLRAGAAQGRYRQVREPRELARLVTTDLQSVNADRHLRLDHHEEEIPDLPDDAMMTSLMQAEAERSMGGVAGFRRLDGGVAHLELGPVLVPPSIAGDAVAAVMQLVARARALILDLRTVRGGHPGTAALVCSYLFDEEPVRLVDVYERETDSTFQSWTLPYVPGARFGGTKPLFVLTSSATFSGGEEIAFVLQRRGRATVVGERTGGGAHPRVGHRVHPHLELSVPTARASDAVTGTNWEGIGVTPDVTVPAGDALRVAHERALARLTLG